MELRQGITGFSHIDDRPLPICDLKSFRNDCHDAARSVGGRVLRSGRRPDNIEANFAMAVIGLAAGPIAILLNCHFPIIGFAIPPDNRDSSPLRFVDCEMLANVLNQTRGYEVVSRNELERVVEPCELRRLLPVEIEQAEYWKPQRVGDVVFNFWD